jgi:amino acid adenylation domain-containing protein
MTRLLQDAITERARSRPDATAVFSETEQLSYAVLEEASNRLANLLVDMGCGRGDRIGLCTPKVPAAVVGLLGILKSGAAYVPLDPTEPAARLARTLESAGCRYILACGDGVALQDAILEARLSAPPLIGWLDKGAGRNGSSVFKITDLAAFAPTPPATDATDADLAQILYTSGSTGTPKGVMITHATILNFIDWATGYFGIDESDRVSQHPPLRFDLSTFDIFGALSNGAELHLVPPEFNMLPHRLAQFIRDRQLTQWLSVPAVLNMMAKFDVIEQGDFPHLRRILFLGEVLPTPTLIHWMRRLPHVSFSNLYGPTEATIASTCYTVPEVPQDPRGPIPIGRPCAGEDVLVLDEQLQPVARGEVGDLYIAGNGLSRGYWRDEEKTAAAFIDAPEGVGSGGRLYRTGDRGSKGADGLLYFAGRRDMQIKCRGYRIELGEIEAALHTLPRLRESVVVAIASEGFEGTLICCAYAPAYDDGPSPRELRAELAQLLPGHMLPMRWLRCEQLPRNVTGKFDRAGLADTFRVNEHERNQPRPDSGLSLQDSPPQMAARATNDK